MCLANVKIIESYVPKCSMNYVMTQNKVAHAVQSAILTTVMFEWNSDLYFLVSKNTFKNNKEIQNM